jgi:hypothetical protein
MGEAEKIADETAGKEIEPSGLKLPEAVTGTFQTTV